ncbi:MAG: hypothetical protein KKH51_09145 [Actinobacteria bacterium]|nr:hypothetical protein [Actinomycetota bacterium]
MELTGVGGGLMLAIAAALWLVYLVPNWFKRREYLATERNAVRLQQTIRVLAETAEVPAAVRAEAAARQVALQQRAEYRQGPVAVGRPVQKVTPSVAQVAAAGRRMRRTRAATTLVLVASSVTAIVQVVAQSWVMLAVSGAAVVGSLALLGRIAEVSRKRSAPAAARPARRTSLGPAEAKAVKREAEWTPVPVPKPMYLSRSVVEAAAAVEDPAFELKLAAVAAERALRNAESEATPLRVAAASASPFASMGIVDDATTGAPDLDAVLARRRA